MRASPQKKLHLQVKTLYKLRKRSIRVILLRRYHDHSEPLFRELKLLSIYQLCLKQMLIFVYKSLNCLLPRHCTNYFIETKSIHSQATRGHETNLYFAKALKVCRRNSIISRGPKYWKLLPNHIKTAPSLNVFKNRLNLHLHATSLT